MPAMTGERCIMDSKFFSLSSTVIIKVSEKAPQHAGREGYFAFANCPSGHIVLRDVHNPKDFFSIPEEDIKTLRKS